jgi:hypothetical protein
MMTRKDYELIAKAITWARYTSTHADNDIYQQGIDRVVIELCQSLKRENSRFDTPKFLAATQYGKLPRREEVVA